MTLALLLVACTDYEVTVLEPGLTVTPTTVDFGPVPIGAASSTAVGIVNSGRATMTLVDPVIAVSGAGALEAEAEALALAPGDSTTLHLTYTAGAAEPDAGSVVIGDESGLRAEVLWTAQGVVGALVAAPEAIDFGGVLPTTEAEQVLALTNTGDAPVTVRDLIVAGAPGFTAAPLVGALPIVLDAGATGVVLVHYAAADATAAAATLTVTAEAPIAPIDVPLTANTVAPNNRPVLSLLSPLDGDTVSLGQTYTLRAFALDTETPATDLVVTFESAVQGVLGVVSPDATGEVLLDTTATVLGDDTITATVVDAAGDLGIDSAAIHVTDCHELSWDRSDTFDATFDSSLFAINGDAYVDTVAEELVLTDAITWQSGALYLQQPILLERFQISTRFRIDPGTGADGIAVVAATGADPELMLGADGEQLGVGNILGVTGFVVELDVFTNGTRADPVGDHVALVSLPAYQHVGVPVEVAELENSLPHDLFVDFDLGHVEVYLDGVLVLSETVPDWVVFEGYLGLTSATGGQANRHVLEQLDVLTGCW